MGTFSVNIEIGDPQGQRFESVGALVETSASDSVNERSILVKRAVIRDAPE